MSRKIFLIGTFHLGVTPKDELAEVLEEIKPDQVFVELPPENSSKRKEAEYISDEMLFAYEWAKKNGVSVASYDTEEDVLEDGVDTESEEHREISDRSVREAKQKSWKDSNRDGYSDGGAWGGYKEKYIDEEKWERREKQMLQNIQKNLASKGTILVLTGMAHLDFFKSNLPEATMYFE